MIKEERIAGLKALAKKYPYAKHVGFSWINPLDSRSKRWTNPDLELFREFQIKYQQNKRKSMRARIK
jgi:hypothetical protein